MKNNRNNYLILKCLTLEERIHKLENKIIELENIIKKMNEFTIYSPEDIVIKPLPTPESNDIKHFHLEMKKVASFDLLQ